uniref:Uncharacterized protein n=1 Tax=Toxoplasma gondii (strain ATCC 50861 / VEG) TaxID=432359 RepID=A0A0F7UPW1_TOXGV|nr:TPA: hypothetical protein BN1205_056940 [Toxoplasma gondii VEG]
MERGIHTRWTQEQWQTSQVSSSLLCSAIRRTTEETTTQSSGCHTTNCTHSWSFSGSVLRNERRDGKTSDVQAAASVLSRPDCCDTEDNEEGPTDEEGGGKEAQAVAITRLSTSCSHRRRCKWFCHLTKHLTHLLAKAEKRIKGTNQRTECFRCSVRDKPLRVSCFLRLPESRSCC